MHRLLARPLSILGATLGTPWLTLQEKKVLTKGSPLSKNLLTWATSQGITNAQKIRLLHAQPLPLPAPIPVRRFLDNRGFPCIHLAGLSLRHGIYLSPDLPDQEAVIRHELIHTRQYQEAGSIFAFLHSYLFQCLTEGYDQCQMEREARGELYTNEQK